jgi:hypothetical protein
MVTTMPCSGGITSVSPAATPSVSKSCWFEPRMSSTLTPNLLAIAFRSSPVPTV